MATAPALKIVSKLDVAIQWNEYQRIEPGTYSAYCTKVSKPYWCRVYKRWQVVIAFDIFSANMQPLAKLVKFLSLGSKREGPRAHRTSKFFAEWIKANGGPPTRNDRLSPSVFARRMATVMVADTDPKLSPAPYSVVREILSWESAPRKQASGLAGLAGNHHTTTQPRECSERSLPKGLMRGDA